jgi:hypothetical protein
MLERDLQEWEEYDARLLDDSPFASGATTVKGFAHDLPRASVRPPDVLEGPFLLESADGAGVREAQYEAEAQEQELETPMPSEALSAPDSQEIAAIGRPWRGDSLEIDPYASVRPALSPEHANLEANEVSLVLGRMPAALVLHQLLNSPQMRQATDASLLGNTGRRSVRLNGSDISIPAYLRLVSHLCREVAGESEAEAGVTPVWESAPQQEQLVMSGQKNTLSASVGRKGVNRPDDVKLVQHLLNSNLPVPPAPIPENGVVDASTISAIEGYQRLILGVKSPDGRVDPGGTAFKSLIANKLAFLPHRCQPLGGGASVAVDATSMNPGFLTPKGATRNAGLQAIVDRRVLANPAFKKLRFALVDLTGSAKMANPQLAGNREIEQGGLGSMAKTACMFAAYQLKFDLEELSRQKGISHLKPLFLAARDLWDDTQKPDPGSVTNLFPADPKVELIGKLIAVDGKPLAAPPGFSTPDLEEIFTSVPAGSGGLTLRFKGSDLILVDLSVPGAPPNVTARVADYARGKGGAVRSFSFAERLFLMIDDSDNGAAHSCIENIGFLYIASALWQCDLYRPERGGGLWEATTHDAPGVHWQLPPVPRQKDNPEADFVSATAASVAALFTLIEQGRLVNRDACAAMKHLMNKDKAGLGSFTRSPFLDGLRTVLTSDSKLVRIHSKLGIGNFALHGPMHGHGSRDDGAIIVRSVPDPADPTKTKQFCYVASGFDDPDKFGPTLQKLIVELDKCIRENNGLLPATAP